MYNLQYSALLVLLLQFEAFAGLPFVPPVLNASDAASGVNVSDSGLGLRSGFGGIQSGVNVSNSPVQSAQESLQAVNVSDASSPAVRLLPDDVAARSLNSSVPLAVAPSDPQTRSAFSLDGASNATQDSPGNRSEVEPRMLLGNTSNSDPFAGSQPQMRSGLSDLGNPSTSPNGSNVFVPSFLKSFGLRKKRGENDTDTIVPASALVPPGNNASLDVSPRSGFDAINGSSAAPVVPPVGDAGGLLSGINVRSGLEPENATAAGNSSLVAPPNANGETILSGVIVPQPRIGESMVDPVASPSLLVPYINVYPLENLN